MVVKDPAAEIQIDEALIKKLLAAQCSQFASLPIQFLDAGWDNENYRLGDKYIIRLPRRQLGANLLVHEINWLPKIQNKLPLPIPAPIFVGQPNQNYPWQWTIVPWYAGKTANLASLEDNEAITLAQFLKVLHRQNTQNAPVNQHRGVPLKEKLIGILERMARLKSKTTAITPKIEALLDRAVEAPFPPEKYLLHGDLHPRNIIIHEGKIAAIIDWGDITSGDVASDLAIFWMLFSNEQVRSAALANYGASEDLIHRAIGWAVFYGVILLDTGLVGNTQHAAIGRGTLRTLNTLSQC